MRTFLQPSRHGRRNERWCEMARGRTQGKALELPKRGYFQVHIVGTSPLLVSRCGDAFAAYMDRKKLQLPDLPRSKWDPIAELKDALDVTCDRKHLIVVDEKGREVEQTDGPFVNPIPLWATLKDKKASFVVPARRVKESIARAVKGTDMAMTDCKTSLAVRAQWLAVVGDDPRMRCDHVRNSSGGPDRRIRAEFGKWEMWLPIVVRLGMWSPDRLASTLADCGEFVGICEWTNESGGVFGSFAVESVVETKPGDALAVKNAKRVA